MNTVVDRWRSFWFRPEPATTLGVVRIAFGVLAIAWTLSLYPDLRVLFGPDGVLPQHPSISYRWGVFDVATSESALLIGWWVLLVSAVAMTVGWHSRIAALLVFVLVVSFDRRNPFVFNSGDVLFRIEALFLALSPCGAALSVDQLRRAGSFVAAQWRAPWALRLMQVQVSLIYLSTVQIKTSGASWPDGTAVSYALRLDDMILVPAPHWVTTHAFLMNVATWATLAVELSIGILVWNRRLRPWVLSAGVIMHLMIMININVGFFSLAMFVAYLAFIPPQAAHRLGHTIQRRLSQSRARFRRENRIHPADSTEVETDDTPVAV